MALGDGIRRNIAHVDPSERALLRDAILELNRRRFGGSRTDTVPGGVTYWFKQDEIHQATHVHRGPEFLPWHREIVNRLEEMIRQVNPQLSLHYWDWTQDPRAIPNANLGGGVTGILNLFTQEFMGHGGSSSQSIGPPWQNASVPWRSDGFYVPTASPGRDDPGGTAADPPTDVRRLIRGTPADGADDLAAVNAEDYADMRHALEDVHNAMHGFVQMGGQHISFRDPFVFLLHSNVDRIFARWQTQPGHAERLAPATVYGSESNADVRTGTSIQNVNNNIEPWSTGHAFDDEVDGEHFARPWYAPENLGVPKTYKHPSVVFPPCYDTNFTATPVVQVMNVGDPPTINFDNVPSGETTMRAAVFRVYGCGDVTVRVMAGASPSDPYSVLYPASGEVTLVRGGTFFQEARIWLAYTAGAAGVPVPDDTVTFECPENGSEFTFVLRANAIERPTVAVMVALDQSGSMAHPAGTSGATRLEVLKDAARPFMELIQKDNGVGVIRFDRESYPVTDPTFSGLDVTRMTSGDIDAARASAIAAVNDHDTNPGASTSVGAGVERAREVLIALPASLYAEKALIVLTDGRENTPPSIESVTGLIDNRTFAIGLGNEHQVNTTALRALARSTNGTLSLTGLLTSSIDDYFRLRKFFLQILAGVTNTDIIRDPAGYIAPGMKVRIPFMVNEADIDCTAILMTDENVVDLVIEAPDGTHIEPSMAASLGIDYGIGDQTKHYRFTLPVAVGEGQWAGQWHAVLTISDDDYKKALARRRDQEDRPFSAFATHGARYCFVAQTFSNLRMAVTDEQSSFEPGADVTFRASLSEYNVPVESRAEIHLELRRPGGSVLTLPMTETEPGVFELSVKAAYAGVYHARYMASGVTLKGKQFTREHLASVAVFTGGDQPYQPARETATDALCRLVTCLLDEKTLSPKLEKRLRQEGVNLETIRECASGYCRPETR